MANRKKTKELKDNTEGLGGLLSVVLTQTQVLQTADNIMDSKTNNLMAAALVIIALLATQLKDGQGHWRLITVAAMAVMISVVSLAIYSTREREYYGTVVDLEKHRDYFAKDNALLLAQLTEDANFANVHNETILADKQKLFRYSTWIFFIGFGLGIVAIFAGL